MPEFAPERLVSWSGGRWTASPERPLAGFSTDTRRIRPGEVFVALRTEKRDGHDFLAAAEAAGAGAAIVSRPDPKRALPQLVVADPLAAFQAIARGHRRGFRGSVVGVTGSAGKTSTKELIALLLGAGAADEPVLATEGNFNNEIGVPLTLTRIDPAAHRYAVIEAGISAPGEMARLAGMIEPNLAVVTLVAPAHLNDLGGIEDVAREKALLPAAVGEGGVAIFPSSCTAFAAFRELKVRTVIATPSPQGLPPEPPSNEMFFFVEHRGESTSITLGGGAPPTRFDLRRVSGGMAQNAALALCAALWLGVPPEVLRPRLEFWRPSPLRGELRRDGRRLLYLDCYNANPASMSDALAAFRAVSSPAEPRMFVLGCMEDLGAETERYHRELGRGLALREEDELFVIGAQAEAVKAGALEAGGRPEQIAVVASLSPVASRLAAFSGGVFVKGSRLHALERLVQPSSHA